MIFYFSGTGNSRHVAQRIAKTLATEVRAMDQMLQSGDLEVTLHADESVGFVLPTYFWGVPAIVREFMERLQLRCTTRKVTARYFFVVATFGTSVGGVHRQMKHLLVKRGWKRDGRFSIRMVDVWTPLFDLSNNEKNRRKSLKAEPVIDRVAEAIQRHSRGRNVWTTLPPFIARMSYRLYDGMRETRHFRVMTDRCIGCGRCEKGCPTETIRLDGEGYPEWTKEECTLCLRCLHSCPAFAIQYGRFTEKHGQFMYPENW